MPGIILGFAWELISYNNFQFPRAAVEYLGNFS